MNEQEVDSWQQQLLAALAEAGDAGVPLRPWLERLAVLSPQQRFDRMQRLLEIGVELVRFDGQYHLVKGCAGPLSEGEWADLAAAVAEAAAGTTDARIRSNEDLPSKTTKQYRSFPFRFRSVETFPGRTRDYHRA